MRRPVKKLKPASCRLVVVASTQRPWFVSLRALDGHSAQHAVTEAGFKAGDVVLVTRIGATLDAVKKELGL